MIDLHDPAPGEIKVTDLTRRDWAHVWWGTFWRGLLTFAGSFAMSFVLGFLLGAVAAMFIMALGGNVDSFRLPLRLMAAALGSLVGLFFFTVWLKWLLHARFGRLRFALLTINSKPPGLPSILASEARSGLENVVPK